MTRRARLRGGGGARRIPLVAAARGRLRAEPNDINVDRRLAANRFDRLRSRRRHLSVCARDASDSVVRCAAADHGIAAAATRGSRRRWRRAPAERDGGAKSPLARRRPGGEADDVDATERPALTAFSSTSSTVARRARGSLPEPCSRALTRRRVRRPRQGQSRPSSRVVSSALHARSHPRQENDERDHLRSTVVATARDRRCPAGRRGRPASRGSTQRTDLAARPRVDEATSRRQPNSAPVGSGGAARRHRARSTAPTGGRPRLASPSRETLGGAPRGRRGSLGCSRSIDAASAAARVPRGGSAGPSARASSVAAALRCDGRVRVAALAARRRRTRRSAVDVLAVTTPRWRRAVASRRASVARAR